MFRHYRSLRSIPTVPFCNSHVSLFHTMYPLQSSTPQETKFSNEIKSQSPPPQQQLSNEQVQQQLQQTLLLYLQKELAEKLENKKKEDSKKETPEARIMTQIPWWIKFIYQNFLGAVLIALYLMYYYSLEPWFDKERTFSGIKMHITHKSDYENTCKREEDLKKLKQEVDRLDSKTMLLLVAPMDSGKTSLLEYLMNYYMPQQSNDFEYEICHLRLKGAAFGLESLTQKLKENMGLETSLIENIIQKALNLNPQKKTQNELVDITSEFEKRLQTKTRIFLKRKKKLKRIIFIDDVSALLKLFKTAPNTTNTNNNTVNSNSAPISTVDTMGNIAPSGIGSVKTDAVELNFVKEFFSWLAQLEDCAVVMASQDGYIADLIKVAEVDHFVKYLSLQDVSKQQVEQMMKPYMTNDKKIQFQNDKLIEFDALWDMFGGRIYHWKRIIKNNNTMELRELIDEAKSKWKEAMDVSQNTVQQSVPFHPNTLKLLCKKLMEHEQDRRFSHLRIIGNGNGVSSCGRGVNLKELLESGIQIDELRNMAKMQLIHFDPTNKTVNVQSRLLFQQMIQVVGGMTVESEKKILQ